MGSCLGRRYCFGAASRSPVSPGLSGSGTKSSPWEREKGKKRISFPHLNSTQLGNQPTNPTPNSHEDQEDKSDLQGRNGLTACLA